MIFAKKKIMEKPHQLFNGRGSCDIETGPLIWCVNQ